MSKFTEASRFTDAGFALNGFLVRGCKGQLYLVRPVPLCPDQFELFVIDNMHPEIEGRREDHLHNDFWSSKEIMSYIGKKPAVRR